MKITVASGKIEKQKTGGLVLPIFEDEKLSPALERVDRALGGTIQRLLKRGDFVARIGSVSMLHPDGKIAAERLLLAGLGPRKEFTLNRLRHMAGTAAAHLRAAGAQDIVLFHDGLDLDGVEAGQALAEGSALGLYRFLKYKSKGNNNHAKEVKQITLLTEVAASVRALQKGVRTGEIIAAASCSVRDMVNHPSADMTPTVMASRARELAKKHRMKVQVLERAQIRKLGMGALLGVASGSAQPPKFIILEYRRGGKKPFVVLVGKTITFDSGGISLKPPENMDRMKDDMAGGAAVLGALQAAAELKLPLNIVGLLPATENMPGGSALKPGDILTTLSGQTIEIINTDAEGRLILSDALTYACRYKPAVIVDIATLTGACGVALGNEAIGMLGNDDTYKQMLREAGERTGERVWELPLWKEYCDYIKSDIADMKNASGRAGGVITAACLLSKFVQKYPWVHLDIAAVALTDKDRPYTPRGATGIGVRLLTQFLREYAKKRS
ncbi:MAG: leucyl aminopeptidase [Nitrospirae bacterium GWC2_57_13]|nr:MAG: leucyl aminopeptidase [Nitrospirae bacterium GWC1_57_7]OGW27981.1 MAG: leucyl aminopeptidase [Nitrospirae bacterium GWC2_57_13]